MEGLIWLFIVGAIIYTNVVQPARRQSKRVPLPPRTRRIVKTVRTTSSHSAQHPIETASHTDDRHQRVIEAYQQVLGQMQNQVTQSVRTYEIKRTTGTEDAHHLTPWHNPTENKIEQNAILPPAPEATNIDHSGLHHETDNVHNRIKKRQNSPFQTPHDIREAFLMMELLQKPVALREQRHT